jgi:Bor protein
MRIQRSVVLALGLCSGLACYHATIETGLTPSTVQVKEEWAASWIGGLVPPKTVSTAAQCPSGVARVETQHSFLNWLVGALTGGIFTPMTIVATCAAQHAAVPGTANIGVASDADSTAIQQAFVRAAEQAMGSGHETLVTFR